MEGEFVAENLSKLQGDVKEKVLQLLSNLGVNRQDVLVALVAGDDVFIQPFKDDYIITSLTPTTNNPNVTLKEEVR